MMDLTCNGLPKRQCLVLKFAALGMTEKETAKAMGCAPSNIRSSRSALFFKLNAHNITEAVAEGFKRGNLTYVPRNQAIFSRRAA